MPDKLEEFVKNLQREIIQREIGDHNEKIVNLSSFLMKFYLILYFYLNFFPILKKMIPEYHSF